MSVEEFLHKVDVSPFHTNFTTDVICINLIRRKGEAEREMDLLFA